MATYGNVLGVHRVWFDVWDEDQGDDGRDDSKSRADPEHTLHYQLNDYKNVRGVHTVSPP